MPRNTSVSLGDHFTSFIDAEVKAGRYGSASEVVRAGLRLLQEHEAKVKALEAALIEGEESGPARDFDFDVFLAKKRAEYERK
ncbi:type II toxin-antitoxin system ParD family antitoxin [Rhodobacter sp. SGA-6-6]|uniref:type II toxin-antitoxin system ParD family antitoxin n=1 Tax=Rhodobacter sp. SGA-6-6 TaxID=2710882 RepID=UPI0013EA82A0|nr:type II toxin-antitoxin system ParD family antitoxin [Rhodobacter sp. SGA-6-6]NGM46558.1 type II toxin-antitoxin system ParD family antitoxin [Rhodobacter sp. SGA-6-6]